MAKKYTHLIERCSSFLRTGVAWRLKEHGYTFSEAYWRLRDGKGLLSSYDQESLKRWSSLITSVRRSTSALRPLLPNDQSELKTKREEILVKMEAYRNRLEVGSIPQYLYEGFPPAILEHVLFCMVRETRDIPTDRQLEIWKGLDMKEVKEKARTCMTELQSYIKEYESATKEQKEKLLKPEEWTKFQYDGKFVKDKIWQIRTDHDKRSSVNAGINQKLNLIWNIPNLTDEIHRSIYTKNQSLLNSYKEWKYENKGSDMEYDMILSKVREVLGSLEIPLF